MISNKKLIAGVKIITMTVSIMILTAVELLLFTMVLRIQALF